MKSTALRIGNFIGHKDFPVDKSIYIITELRHISLEVLDYPRMNFSETFGYDDIVPVPLTDEWLKVLGFGYKHKDSGTRWSIRAFDVWTDFTDEYGDPTDNHNRYRYDFTEYVDFVHELQNLYFKKTGAELKHTITLK